MFFPVFAKRSCKNRRISLPTETRFWPTNHVRRELSKCFGFANGGRSRDSTDAPANDVCSFFACKWNERTFLTLRGFNQLFDQ